MTPNQKLITHNPEKEQKIPESKNIVKRFGKEIFLILASVGVLGAGYAYKNTSDSKESQFPSSIDVNSTNNKESSETTKVYDNLTIIYDLAKLFEEKGDLDKVLFSQEDLENILITYSKTKDTLGKNTLKVIHSILKDMIINTLKEGYNLKGGYEELDLLKEYLTIFSGGEINIRYSKSMPKNAEFDNKLTIIGDIDSNNKLTIKRATKTDVISEYFDTNDNVFKYPRIFELFQAFYKDLPKGYVMLSNEANKANLESMENFASLVEARSKISTLEIIIKRLHEEKSTLIKNHKIEVLDLKDDNDITAQKDKENNSHEIELINTRHSNETKELETYIQTMTEDLVSYKILLENKEKKFIKTIEELNSKFELVNNDKSLQESQLDSQRTKIEDLTSLLKEEKSDKKKVKDELSLLKKDQNTLLNTIGINKSQRITKIARLERDLSAKTLNIKNLSNEILKEKEINEQLTEQGFISLTLSKILSHPTIESINNNIDTFKKEISILKEKIKDIRTNKKDKKEFQLKEKALNQILKFLNQIQTNNGYKAKSEKDTKEKELINSKNIELSTENNELNNDNNTKDKTIKAKNSIIAQLTYTLKGVRETLSLKTSKTSINPSYKDKILEEENHNLKNEVQKLKEKVQKLEKTEKNRDKKLNTF